MLKLKRTYFDKYTSGELTLFKNNNDGNNNSNNNLKIKLYTLEPPYKDNQQNISCIPEGRYIVKRHKSPKFGDCFIVETEDDKCYQTSELLFDFSKIDSKNILQEKEIIIK